MTTEQKNFIESIAAAVKKYAPSYGIRVYSPIIAQAINESGWGKSTLASKYHNYFGMKCGSAWTGKSVNMTTQEEYTVGTLTTIKDNFRVYDSLDDGVKGYFDFISASRYANLKGVTDPETYLKNIKADGYATSSTYVSNLMNIVNSYSLTEYDDNGGNATQDDSEDKSVDELAQEVIAGKWGNGSERKEKLEAAGYDYSAVQAKVNELAGGSSAEAVAPEKSVDEVAQEVVAGKWGNGSDRKARLEAAGYDYSAVQAKVNTLLSSGSAKATTTTAAASSKRTHTVVSGDTTSALAKKYGTTIAKIVAKNKSKYPKITAAHIEIGWVLDV